MTHTPTHTTENIHLAEEKKTRGVSLRAIAQMAVFAALIGALGLMGAITVPGLVPITAQTLGVLLAGMVLGPWRGAGAVLLLLFVVALGVPLLAGGRGGIGAFLSPSAGYLIGFIFSAMVIGLIVHGVRGTGRPRLVRLIIAAIVGGILTIYAFGVPIQAAMTGMGLWETITTSMIAFLPGDTIKAVLAVIITLGLWKAYPRAFQN